MKNTLRDALSELATDLKARNHDDRISYRYLNSKFKSKMDYFLRLESKSRELLRDYTLWKKLRLEPLEEIPLEVCGMVDVCKSVKRTVNKLPEIVTGIYGKMVKVFSLDDSKEYVFINSINYKDHMNRKYMKNKYVFWIDEDKIVIPNADTENIAIYLIPKDESEVDKMNGDISQCQGPLDGVLKYPDYLITLAKQEVLKELLGSYVRVIEDEKGDDNNNIKD